MLGTQAILAFVPTSDPERARPFYEGVLGLPLKRTDAYALVFDVNGTELRVPVVKDLKPVPYTIFGWIVPNIHEAVATLNAKGVVFEIYPFLEQDAAGVWTTDGAKVAWFRDPDGNVLSLTEYIAGTGNTSNIAAGIQPNLMQAVPFFRAANMDRSLAFYTGGLGFSIKLQWTPRGVIEWCWLDRDGVALMLQEPRRDQPVRPLEGKPGLGVSICIQCRDAVALYHEFLGRGLAPSEPFVGNGMWVTHVIDPDGYRVEFESLTDVPEGTAYSEWKKN